MPFEIPENWCWTTVSAISKSILYGVSESAKVSGKYRLLRITDIQNNNVQWNTVPYTDYDANKAESYLLNNGDILFARTGATVGKSYLVQGLTEKVIYASYLIRVQTYDAVLPQYVKFYFESGYYWEQIERESVGVGQPNVNGFILGNLQIPIPPIHEQNRIVLELTKCMDIIDAIEDRTIELESYIRQTKSKILDLAISGKLVPQDPNDEPAIELMKRINPNFEPCDNSHYENLPENWCLAKVKDVFAINPRNKAEDNTIAGFIPMTLIDDGYSNTFSYEKRKWESIKTGFTHFADGDVAVAKISPCLENRKSIVLRDLPNGIGAGTTELHVFRSSVVVPEYALYFFKSECFISKCVGTFNGVVGQQRVGKNIIEEIQIPIPPINEQKKIVSTIETIFTQLNTITAEL